VNHFLTSSGQVKGNSENQNSDEEGVFISDIARKLSGLEDHNFINLQPAQIRAFSFRLISPNTVKSSKKTGASTTTTKPETSAANIIPPVPQTNQSPPPSEPASSSLAPKPFKAQSSRIEIESTDENSTTTKSSSNHGYMLIIGVLALSIFAFFLRKRNSISGKFRNIRKLK
jgi:hypothetical protein